MSNTSTSGSSINSWLALIIGVATPIIPTVIPALQTTFGANPYVSAAIAAFMVLWNHFSTPVHKT